MWVTTRPHHPEFAENILDKSPQGYSGLQKQSIMEIADEDLLRQVAAVHHLKNCARKNLRVVSAI